MNPGQSEIGESYHLYAIFLHESHPSIVQTAKQSCELLLKVFYPRGKLTMMPFYPSFQIIDSILDYSKLEASGESYDDEYGTFFLNRCLSR